MLSIKEYNYKTCISDDIDTIKIDLLIYPLNNLPMSINKIIINRQINVLR